METTKITNETILRSACYRAPFKCPCRTKVLSETCDISANEVFGCASVRSALKNGTVYVEETK